MKQDISIHIFGKVQGVFFRDSARREAVRLNVTGFANNLPDGSVHIEAEGEDVELKKFIAWCRKGSMKAKVEKVEVEYVANLKNYISFKVQ